MGKGLSLTCLKARYDLFMTKLRLTALLVLLKVQDIIKKKSQKTLLTANDVREVCKAIREEKDSISFTSFYKRITHEYVNFETLIEFACETYIELSSIGEFARKNELGQYVTMPLRQLWEYIL